MISPPYKYNSRHREPESQVAYAEYNFEEFMQIFRKYALDYFIKYTPIFQLI